MFIVLVFLVCKMKETLSTVTVRVLCSLYIKTKESTYVRASSFLCLSLDPGISTCAIIKITVLCVFKLNSCVAFLLLFCCNEDLKDKKELS